ncbi:hypothetical protein ACHAXA_007778 [Cyclostephanos tholiformis]|uniref:Uncharacterized protein n=1 Tax=Cyclostephanos tholiformis TaxID=382380 RepID=A0ABD3R959_9STRA
MALTGYVDDSPEMVKTPTEEVGSNENDRSVEEDDVSNNLSASNLEEHDRTMGEGGIEHNNRVDADGDSDAKTQVGAGLLFGLSGLILGGPIVGILTGVGAAVVASKNDGPAGDVARSAGAFAVETGSMVGETAKDVNEKHGILEKIKNVLASGWRRAQQLDEEHKIGDRTRETIDGVRQKTVEFEKEHHLMQSILEGVHNGVGYLLDKLKSATAPCEGRPGTSSG